MTTWVRVWDSAQKKRIGSSAGEVNLALAFIGSAERLAGRLGYRRHRIPKLFF